MSSRGSDDAGIGPKCKRKDQIRENFDMPIPFDLVLQSLTDIRNIMSLSSQAANVKHFSNNIAENKSTPGLSSAYFNQLKADIAQHERTCADINSKILFNMRPSSDSNKQSSSSVAAVNHISDDKLIEQKEMVINVETRLNQIREYIKTTLLMMESLKKSSDPRAKTQHEKLGRMVEDLYDSEIKLSKLLKQYRSQGNEDENFDQKDSEDNYDREKSVDLYKKMEESQKKLTQLQEHQNQLVGMQKAMTESLKEARELRNNLMLLDPEESTVGTSAETETQMVALVAKLSQLQAKKQNMDQLITELNSTTISERCTSEAKSIREKEIELEGLKSQLAHLKTLMENAVKGREDNIEPEADEQVEEEEAEKNDTSCDNEDFSMSIKPKLDEIQAVTKELKEQAVLLQAARAEVAALKQSYKIRSNQNTASNSSSGSISVPCDEFIPDRQTAQGNQCNDNVDSQAKRNEEPSRKGKGKRKSKH